MPRPQSGAYRRRRSDTSKLKAVATQYLRDAVGDPGAAFRDGQWEGIRDAVLKKRVLVVQRTGWGKTMVYLIATKLLRERGEGPSLMITPLIALMRNQLLAAEALGLKARMFISDNYPQWGQIKDELRDDEVDLVMITPERIANEGFATYTLPLITRNLGLLIIDEAHCISDWGHDFRPDYQRVRRVQAAIPRNAPIIATTATANNRVVDDVQEQLGSKILVSRGSLVRRSLRLQNLVMPDSRARLGWLAEAVPQMDRSGIIYTLTRKDADLVADWLRAKGINAAAYHGSSGRRSANGDPRAAMEEALLDNRFKVLVATIALGMGFDKPDLGFIVHYQRPPSVVHYYQQVGRAGRGIDDALGILLWGHEDDQIADYFADQAFPPQDQIDSILETLEDTDGGLSAPDLEAAVNLRRSTIEKALKMMALASPAPVVYMRGKWHASPGTSSFAIDPDYVQRIRTVRAREMKQMQDYMRHEGCLMEFLQSALDDDSAGKCGRCRNCTGQDLVPVYANATTASDADHFVRNRLLSIVPASRWPIENLSDHPIHERIWIDHGHRAKTGRVLSLWMDGAKGNQIIRERRQAPQYSNDVVVAAMTMIRDWNPQPRPNWVTFVPPRGGSRHVPALAEAIAQWMGVPCLEVVRRTGMGGPQQGRLNMVQRASNVASEFIVDRQCSGMALLIDDLTVSGWTLTTVAAQIRYNGARAVHPMALVMRKLAQ